MSEGLEALKAIEKRLYGDIPGDVVDDDLYIIEKELKRLEVYDKCNYETTIHKDVLQLSKELKALEIIKDKGLSNNDIAFIKKGDSWETYVETMKELHWGDEQLDRVLKNEEEYNLLKEVLQ